jgi:hypothetical protein
METDTWLRRAELQRTTLLELQDALLELLRGAAGTEYFLLTDLEDEEQRRKTAQANRELPSLAVVWTCSYLVLTMSASVSWSLPRSRSICGLAKKIRS